MKATLLLAVLFTSSVLAFCADAPPDLTGAKADKFKTHLGQAVCLTGRLEVGVYGFMLSGSNTNKVLFFLPCSSSTNSTSWKHLLHKQVRVTGELRFYTWRGPKTGQFPPDYYYIIRDGAKVEESACK